MGSTWNLASWEQSAEEMLLYEQKQTVFTISHIRCFIVLVASTQPVGREVIHIVNITIMDI